MKSQGLPINFIVLIGIGMLVLFLLIMFVLSGFRTEAVASQTAINNCNSRCATEMQVARTKSSPYQNENSSFCKITQNVVEIGDGLRCDQLVDCTVTTRNGVSCQLACTDAVSSCAV